MQPNIFVDRVEHLEKTLANHQDILGETATVLQQKFTLKSAQDIVVFLKNQEDSTQLLRIGIIGRVKAGKSSILNALLFGGQDVLPKAATPMTAALTTIGFSEQPKGTVELFNKNDIENLQRQHDKYERLLAQSIADKKEKFLRGPSSGFPNKQNQTKIEQEDLLRIEGQAKAEIEQNAGMAAAHDTYQRIKKNKLDNFVDNKNRELSGDTIDELKSQIGQYVGSDGRYMPITKCLHIRIPQPQLKDLEIVDTPGVNDPIVSRENRTLELLSSCDVVVVVSPAGQFLSDQDMELIDRVTGKEGILEIYLVASQSDTQLFGSIMQENNANYVAALDDLKKSLMKQTRGVLKEISEKESGEHAPIRNLLENIQQRFIVSSSVADTILQIPEAQLDENAKHVYGMLQQNYPKAFNKTNQVESLRRLSAKAQMDDIILSSRERKNEIMGKRVSAFLANQEDVFTQFILALKQEIKTSRDRVLNTDINDIKSKIEGHSCFVTKLESVIANVLDDVLQNFGNKLSKRLSSILYEASSKASTGASNAEGHDTRKVKKDGPFSWFARFLGLGGYENQRYQTIATSDVKMAINKFRNRISDEMIQEYEEHVAEFKKTMTQELISSVRKTVGDDNVDGTLWQKNIRSFVAQMSVIDKPKLPAMPRPLNRSGTLTDDDAEEYLSEAYEFIEELEQECRTYICDLQTHIKAVPEGEFAGKILLGYKNEMLTLKVEIENKQLYVNKYNRLFKELGAI